MSLPTIAAEEIRYFLLSKYQIYMQYMPNYRNYLYCTTYQKEIIWQEIELTEFELPVIVRWIALDNWSFLTTHRFFDYKNELRETGTAEILKIDFDIPLFGLDDWIREFIITMPEHKIWVVDVPNSTSFEMIGFWNMLNDARKFAKTYQIDKRFIVRTKEEKLAIWNS